MLATDVIYFPYILHLKVVLLHRNQYLVEPDAGLTTIRSVEQSSLVEQWSLANVLSVQIERLRLQGISLN
jgi:hypothetical protein